MRHLGGAWWRMDSNIYASACTTYSHTDNPHKLSPHSSQKILVPLSSQFKYSCAGVRHLCGIQISHTHKYILKLPHSSHTQNIYYLPKIRMRHLGGTWWRMDSNIQAPACATYSHTDNPHKLSPHSSQKILVPLLSQFKYSCAGVSNHCGMQTSYHI